MKLKGAIELFLASLEGVKAPATVAWYSYRLAGLEHRLGEHQLRQITISDLRRWRRTLGDQRSTWTRHGHVRAVRRLFRWLAAEGHTPSNLADRLELPRLTFKPCPGIDFGDMLKMVSAARASSARDHALVLFLADTAARVGGVSGLMIADLDLAAGRALVIEKGSKARAVFFRPCTAAALAAYIGQRRAGPVFLSEKGQKRLLGSGIYRVLKRLADRAGVTEHWNPHSFRHGAARAMLRRGANLAQVSQILGHSDVSVTVKFYGSFVDEELRRLHRRYSWVPGEK